MNATFQYCNPLNYQNGTTMKNIILLSILLSLMIGACSEPQIEVSQISREIVKIDTLGEYEDIFALGTFKTAYDTIFKTTLSDGSFAIDTVMDSEYAYRTPERADSVAAVYRENSKNKNHLILDPKTGEYSYGKSSQ
jgi:hypothetical protein